MQIRAAVVPLIAAAALGYTVNDLVSPQASESARTDQQLRYLKFIDRDLYAIHKDITANTKKVEAVRVAVTPLASSMGSVDHSAAAVRDATSGIQQNGSQLLQGFNSYTSPVAVLLHKICVRLSDPGPADC